jgi:hypothetical protein
MASRSELDRRAIQVSKSPLARHSLNQKNIRDQRAGVTRVFGNEVNNAYARQRRDESREERRQALYDSIFNIFEGNVSEVDIASLILLSDEFETTVPEAPNATIIDFTRIKPTNASYGEPGLFRKKK